MTALPPALAALGDYPQFCLYLARPGAKPGKIDKLPCDALGNVIDAHDPANWMTREAAERVAAQHGGRFGLAFVFTDADPFWFLDIDKCLQPDGTWSPLAQQLCATFAGCAVEVSTSGTGLHIFGTGAVPEHGCVNRGAGLELYTSGRFVALTGTHAVGDARTVARPEAMQWLVGNYFPPREGKGAPAQWTDGPCAEWRGPTDDDELIRRALRSGGARAAFGLGASFADLWTADADALARAFPPDANGTGGHNGSSADMALASHLAFWTGRDCERIKRLMMQSALRREKWERDDYMDRTILGACALSRDVLQDKALEAARRRKQLEEQMAIGDGTDEVPPAEAIDEETALERFVLLTEGKRVADIRNPRHVCTLDEFDAKFAASIRPAPIETHTEAAIRRAQGRPKPRAVPITKVWLRSPLRKTVESLTFNPGAPILCKDPNGRDCLNTWRPLIRPDLPIRDDYQSMFIGHVEYLFGRQTERAIDWLAHIEQHPGELPHTGYVHVSDHTGTGRNWVSAVLCRVWPGYVAAGYNLPETLETGFNGRLAGKLLAIVDEIREGGSGMRHATQQRLKSIVTEHDRQINPKYGRQHVERNACRWLLFSNHIDALAIDDNDRRFNVVRCTQEPRPAEYYRSLYVALRDPAFAVSVAALLRTRDLSGFNPGEKSDDNADRSAMIAASRPELVTRLLEFAEEHPADVVTTKALRRAVGAENAGGAWRHALSDAGFERTGLIPTREGGRDRCFIIRNHHKWKTATPHQLVAEIDRGNPLIR